MIKMFWMITLGFMLCCLPAVASNIPQTSLLEETIGLGDYYFEQGDYFLAFKEYRKALNFEGAQIPALHYRLGRVYGLLEPSETLCEKEYVLALSLYLRKLVDLDQVNVQDLRKALGIPISQQRGSALNDINPLLMVKKDIDDDQFPEAYVIFRRGQNSFALFALEYIGHLPKVSHLLSFIEGQSGAAKLDFEDVNADGFEEIMVRVQMKDFYNLFIFGKDSHGSYARLLDASSLFLGNSLFTDIAGDAAKEIQVLEKLRDHPLFDPQKGPYLSRKSFYAWDGDRYVLVEEELLKDDIWALSEFLKALMIEGDFEQAYRWIVPEPFFKNLNWKYDFKAFKQLMRTEEYALFLSENVQSAQFAGTITVELDPARNAAMGWQSKDDRAGPFPYVQENDRYYLLKVGPYSYELTMSKKGSWKVTGLQRHASKLGGWQLN